MYFKQEFFGSAADHFPGADGNSVFRFEFVQSLQETRKHPVLPGTVKVAQFSANPIAVDRRQGRIRQSQEDTIFGIDVSASFTDELLCAEKEFLRVVGFNGFFQSTCKRTFLIVFEDQAAELFVVFLITVLEKRGKQDRFFLPLMMAIGKTVQQSDNISGIRLVESLSMANPNRHSFQNVEGSEYLSVFFF
jgi:hypothetical protein